MDADEKQRQRLERQRQQTERIIKDHIARGPRVCCFDKHKGNIPSSFVRCPDCIKPLDKTESIC